MSRFRPIDRKTAYLLPPSVEDWLPQDHLARFIVESIEQLDLTDLTRVYAGRGSAAYHPEVLLSLLVYGYATATFSSRRIERATYDSVAFRYLAAGSHPDHDTLARFRRRFLEELGGVFLQVLELASEMKLLKLGTVSLDGTKVHANASRHSALSHGRIVKLETQLKAEVEELLATAEQADQTDIPDGVNLPEEIERREDRLAVMAAAKAKIEARAQVRFEAEQAAFEVKLAKRAARAAESGCKPTGKPPQPPTPDPRPEDQINLTDEESRIMSQGIPSLRDIKVAGGGFEQCYNAQAAVDAPTMLVVAAALTNAGNDKQQVQPMLDKLGALPASLGRARSLLADTGYCSANNIAACEEAGIDPYIAVAKDDRHPGWRERFTEPLPLEVDATPMQKMAYKLKTKLGRMLYALRKQSVEPVFGIIKSVMGFRQFLLRGLEKAKGEWTLVCLAWNLKRMAVLRQKSVRCA